MYVEPGPALAERNMSDAMHTDRVVARIEGAKPDGRREGRIIRVLERGITRLVGRYDPAKGYGFVVSTDKRVGRDLYISQEDSQGAEAGDLVVAEITTYPTQSRNPVGRILQVLGPAVAGVESRSAVTGHTCASCS